MNKLIQRSLVSLKTSTAPGLCRNASLSARPAVVAVNQCREYNSSKILMRRRKPHLDKLTDDDVITPENKHLWEMPIDELALSIDTTLTEEQKEKVARIKRKIKGKDAVRSLYRDVPTTQELEMMKFPGNFRPQLAPNAEALVDYAIAQLPEGDGPRRSKHKKRMQQRQQQIRDNHTRRKLETHESLKRKHKKKAYHDNLVKFYYAEAAKMRQEAESNKQMFMNAGGTGPSSDISEDKKE